MLQSGSVSISFYQFLNNNIFYGNNHNIVDTDKVHNQSVNLLHRQQIGVMT